MIEFEKKLKKLINKKSPVPNYPHNIVVPDELYECIKQYSTDIHVLQNGRVWNVVGHQVRNLTLHKTKKSIILLIVNESKAIIDSYKKELKTENDAPIGQHTLSATIKKLSYKHSVLKMLVEFENKSTAYGTAPTGIKPTDTGKTIKFSANYKHCPENKTHAYLNYPVLKTK